jgi:hypothetical protein
MASLGKVGDPPYPLLSFVVLGVSGYIATPAGIAIANFATNRPHLSRSSGTNINDVRVDMHSLP